MSGLNIESRTIDYLLKRVSELEGLYVTIQGLEEMNAYQSQRIKQLESKEK